MKEEKGGKLNSLITKWPASAVFTCNYLNKHGFTYSLIKLYRKSNWLIAIGRGAVARAGDEVDWSGGLYALQTQLGLAVHAGAKTALELHGSAHFLPLGEGSPLFLFGAPATKLPTWFKQHDWKRRIVFTAPALFSEESPLGLTDHRQGAYSIKISTRERAILELLDLVPKHQHYSEARLLMEGLRTLRPQLLQSLLEQCTSVKAKRLFLHLAEATSQEWFSRLDLSKIELGSGKRVIGEGGTFDSKYNISVPAGRELTTGKTALEGP